jgi:hypothetical protein
MATYVDCVFAQARLEAFVDEELALSEQVLVESHLRWCTTCAARVDDLQLIGGTLRSRARVVTPVVDRELEAAAAVVVDRARVERQLSLGGRMRRVIESGVDLRFVWPAVGATAALVLCVALAWTTWQATAEQQPTSLAAMIGSLSDPGSDHNPMRIDGAFIAVPRVLNTRGDVAHAMLDDLGDAGGVLAVAAVVTREGRVGTFELLERRPASSAPGQVEDLLDAVRQARFAPAQAAGGRRVAVNMVWLFASTTVRPSAIEQDLGVPLSRPVAPVRRIHVPGLEIFVTPDGGSGPQEGPVEPVAAAGAASAAV